MCSIFVMSWYHLEVSSYKLISNSECFSRIMKVTQKSVHLFHSIWIFSISFQEYYVDYWHFEIPRCDYDTISILGTSWIRQWISISYVTHLSWYVARKRHDHKLVKFIEYGSGSNDYLCFIFLPLIFYLFNMVVWRYPYFLNVDIK